MKKSLIITNRKSTTAFQRAIDKMRTLRLSPQRVVQEANFSKGF